MGWVCQRYKRHGYGHFNTFGNFEFYPGIEVASSIFGVVIGMRLLFMAIPLDEDDLGELKGEKLSVIAGIMFVLFFAIIAAATTLDEVYFESFSTVIKGLKLSHQKN